MKVAGLRKAFGERTVLDGIDLDVAQGTICSLLGPNGAGKTTIVQILSTLLRPDAGEIQVAGFDLNREPDAVRASIGLTGQFSAVDNLLTGGENLRLMADLHHLTRGVGQRRAAELLERFDLVDATSQMVATYSGGMRRRLDLAMTVIGDPRIPLLDEPTTGLDPRSRRTLWQILRDLVATGITVLLTTQHLEEPTSSPIASRSSTEGASSLEAHPTSSNVGFPVVERGCISAMSTRYTRRWRCSATPRATTIRWSCTSRRTAPPRRWLRCSTGSTITDFLSSASPCTRPTSTVSSSR